MNEATPAAVSRCPKLVLTEPTRAAVPGGDAVRLGQGRDLDRIADRRSSAVGLDVADGRGGNAGNRQGLGDAPGLAIEARRQVADLAASVVVHRRPAQQRVDVIAGSSGLGGPSQHHDAGAAAEDGAAGVGVESAAMTVGRQDLAVVVEVAEAMRQLDADATGKCQVAFAVQQALRRHVDGHERRRAGGLHGHARPLQVEAIGDARREEVLVVAGVPHQERADLLHQPAIGCQVMHVVVVHPRPGEHADGTGERLGNVARVFEGLPAHFEEVAVLRVEDGGLAGAESEEPGVEVLQVGQRRPGRNVVGVADQRGILAGAAQIGIAEPAHRLHPGSQVEPELADVAGAREPARHADDGNVLGTVDGGNGHWRPVTVSKSSAGVDAPTGARRSRRNSMNPRGPRRVAVTATHS